MSWATEETVRLCGYVGNHGHSTLGLGLCYYYYFFYTLVRYIPKGFEKKNEKKLTNRYDTQSAQSNAGKQSWSRTASKRCNNTEILWKRKHVSLASTELLEIL